MNLPWTSLITFLLIENCTVIAEYMFTGNLFKDDKEATLRKYFNVRLMRPVCILFETILLICLMKLEHCGRHALKQRLNKDH